jgi:hypothetical protein
MLLVRASGHRLQLPSAINYENPYGGPALHTVVDVYKPMLETSILKLTEIQHAFSSKLHCPVTAARGKA